jgi:SNF2 family DNA or RNA helicase
MSNNIIFIIININIFFFFSSKTVSRATSAVMEYDYELLAAAHTLLKSVMLRRLKHNVMNLPPKAEVFDILANLFICF